MFNSLRLSIVVTAEILAKLISRTKLLAEILTEVLIEILKVKASLVVYCLGFSVS